MLNYRVQDGCHNCAHVFVRRDFDGVGPYCCTLNAPPRPPCQSVAMGDWDPNDTAGEGFAKWDAWKAGREVTPMGICDAWEKDPLDGIENDDQPQYILGEQGYSEGAT